MVRPENIIRAVEAYKQMGQSERFIEFTATRRLKRGRDLNVTTFVGGVVAVLGDEDVNWMVVLITDPFGSREVAYLPLKHSITELRSSKPEAVRWLAQTLRLENLILLR